MPPENDSCSLSATTHHAFWLGGGENPEGPRELPPIDEWIERLLAE